MSELSDPRAGDIILVDLESIRGSEQAGIHPAIVVSVDELNLKSLRIAICPITGNLRPWPTKVPVPETCKTRGMVLTDQLRAIDRRTRVLRRIEATPPEFLTLVRSHVGRLIGLVLPQERG